MQRGGLPLLRTASEVRSPLALSYVSNARRVDYDPVGVLASIVKTGILLWHLITISFVC